MGASASGAPVTRAEQAAARQAEQERQAREARAARGAVGRPAIDVPRLGNRPDPYAPTTPAAPPAGPGGGSYPSEEPGFGEALAGLFTPPAPTVIPTPYGDSYGAPGGSPAILGLVAVGALGVGAWYLWKRGRA